MKKFLIAERKAHTEAIVVSGKSKYDVLKNFIASREDMRIYWSGRNPYAATLYSGLGSREFVAFQVQA
jgi:hypothetical protein